MEAIITGEVNPAQPAFSVTYKATDDWDDHIDDRGFGWRPSIHMPRWASRITLEITGVRVERLQDISEADAKAEGITVLPLQNVDDPSAWWQSSPGENQARTPIASFRNLWDSINAKRGYSWESNPWVWVIEFKHLEN